MDQSILYQKFSLTNKLKVCETFIFDLSNIENTYNNRSITKEYCIIINYDFLAEKFNIPKFNKFIPCLLVSSNYDYLTSFSTLLEFKYPPPNTNITITFLCNKKNNNIIVKPGCKFALSEKDKNPENILDIFNLINQHEYLLDNFTILDYNYLYNIKDLSIMQLTKYFTKNFTIISSVIKITDKIIYDGFHYSEMNFVKKSIQDLEIPIFIPTLMTGNNFDQNIDANKFDQEEIFFISSKIMILITFLKKFNTTSGII